jgi:hypothetical protein
MDDYRWREVWDETQAALEHLEESVQTVRALERTALHVERARTLSEGIKKALTLMSEGLQQVRAHTQAADIQLTAAVSALQADTVLNQELQGELFSRRSA